MILEILKFFIRESDDNNIIANEHVPLQKLCYCPINKISHAKIKKENDIK